MNQHGVVACKLAIGAAFMVAICTEACFASDNNTTCTNNALSEYNKAELALMFKSEGLVTVKTAIARRRLQGDYCLKTAHCQADALASQTTTMALDAAFSRCLEEEAKEDEINDSQSGGSDIDGIPAPGASMIYRRRRPTA